MDILRKKLESLKSDYNQAVGKRDKLLVTKKEEEDRLTELSAYQDVLEQVNALLQKTAEYQRNAACKQIEALGTYALQYVFGSNFRLEISISEIRNRPEAEIYVVSLENGEEIRNIPQDSRGGGIVDIVSLALKIVMLQVYEPQIDGPIILDEPGKHVSSEYIEPLSNFLKEVSEKFDRQIILVTHNAYLAEIADKKISVVLEDGRSKVI